MDFENIYAPENLVPSDTDVKPEDKPIDVKPIEDKPVDTPPVEVKPVDEKPADVKPTDDKPKDNENAFDAIKISSRLSEILGEEIKDLNDEVFTKIDTKVKANLENETSLQSKIAELQALVDKKPDYKNSKLARIDKMQELTGIEDISVLSKLVSKDVKNMSAFEAIKTAFILDNPDVDNDEDIDAYILEKFGVSDKEELDGLVGSDKIKLKQEERTAKTKLDGVFSELNKNNDKTEAEKQIEAQKQEAYVKAWTNIGETAKANIKEINVPIIDNGKESVYMTYALKDADSYFQEMIDHLTSNGKELTEENLKEGLDFVEARYFLDHKAEIISSIVAKERSAVIEEYDKKYANVVPLGSPIEKGSGEETQKNDYLSYIKSL